MHKSTKLRWAKKLMRARYYVVLTDKEAVIAMDGVNPKSMNDIVALQAQAAEIEEFSRKLHKLAQDHEKIVGKLLAVKSQKRKTKEQYDADRRKPTKKTIKVKNG